MGTLWHTIRRNDNTWQPGGMQQIPGKPSINPFYMVAAATADRQSVQVVAGCQLHTYDQTGPLFYTVRYDAGYWQPQPMQVITTPVYGFETVTCTATAGRVQIVAGDGAQLYYWQPPGMTLLPGQPGRFDSVACAGTATGLHVVGISSDGVLYHTVGDGLGNWQPEMQPVPGQPADVTFMKIALATADGQSLQVVGLSNNISVVDDSYNGQLYHTICDGHGNWQPEGMQLIPGQHLEVLGIEDPEPLAFSAIASTGTPSGLHVVGIADVGRNPGDGNLFYTFRDGFGNWRQPSMELIPGQGGVTFTEAAVVSVDEQSVQVVGVAFVGDLSSSLYHTIRDNLGNWQPEGMQLIPGQPADIRVTAASLTGTSVGLQVVGVAL